MQPLMRALCSPTVRASAHSSFARYAAPAAAAASRASFANRTRFVGQRPTPPTISRIRFFSSASACLSESSQHDDIEDADALRRKAKQKRKRYTRIRFAVSMAVGLGIGIFWGLLDYRIIKLEDENTVQPPAKCEPFPRVMTVRGSQYRCLGVGVRVVSFLRMPVYALGIYVAEDDVSIARKLLDSIDDVRAALTDDDRSTEVISKLVRGGVRFLIRVTPVRNTDFGHLRDGFVRSILKNPIAIQLMSLPDSGFGEGLAQIKQAFGRKRKAYKGDSLLMVGQANGDLNMYFSPESNIANLEHLGDATNPDVQRVFLLQYLTGKSPNSPTARDSTIQGLLALI